MPRYREPRITDYPDDVKYAVAEIALFRAMAEIVRWPWAAEHHTVQHLEAIISALFWDPQHTRDEIETARIFCAAITRLRIEDESKQEYARDLIECHSFLDSTNDPDTWERMAGMLHFWHGTASDAEINMLDCQGDAS